MKKKIIFICIVVIASIFIFLLVRSFLTIEDVTTLTPKEYKEKHK